MTRPSSRCLHWRSADAEPFQHAEALKESGALNAQLSLYGFWNEHVTLTKSGDVLMVLSVPGVDYESLDREEQQYAVRRLESALKAFGGGFHVYQYLFKTNRPEILFADYGDELIHAAWRNGVISSLRSRTGCIAWRSSTRSCSRASG